MNTEFWYVMVFYALLSCFLMPFAGQYFLGDDSGLENGYIAGTVVSMALWFIYGKKYANM